MSESRPATMSTHRNPKDSMKSTWRHEDRSQWGPAQWTVEYLNIHHIDLDREVPVHAKQDKVPYMSDISVHHWILLHAFLVTALHQLYVLYTGRNVGLIVAFLYYDTSIRVFATRELRQLRELGHMYGFLDGDKHERDGVPDLGVNKALMSVLMAGFLRPLMTALLTYDVNIPPLSMNWVWLPVEISLYGIILDFWYYWYHRLMHEVPWLWKYHRTHHLTKHPNPLLTVYADVEPEFFDIIGIPFMTFITMKTTGLPLGFYELYICQLYVIFAELLGHSGLRIHATASSPVSWLLRMLDVEIVIEDHDLHHRTGWKKSYNYGKQTRIWDRVFGTCGDRIESENDNVDYEQVVWMPLW